MTVDEGGKVDGVEGVDVGLLVVVVAGSTSRVLWWCRCWGEACPCRYDLSPLVVVVVVVVVGCNLGLRLHFHYVKITLIF